MNYYIYSHIQEDTGEVFYIGKGKGNRAYSDKDRSNLWKNVAKKHGWKVVLLCNDLTELEAFEVEKFYIKEYGRRDLGTGTLVNMTDGGEGRSNPSEETRKKISDKSKGHAVSEEHRKKISEKLTGRVFSEETRKKMSDSQKGNTKWEGRKHSDETIKKMSDAAKGKKHSDETRKKISDAAKLRGKRVFTEEWKKNIALARRNKKQLTETRKKISDTLKEFYKKK